MRGRRLLVGCGVAVLAVVVLLFGGIFSGSHAANPVAAAVANAKSEGAKQDALSQLLAGFSTGNTAAYVTKLERHIETNAADAEALVLLGLSYQQRGRETGDPTFYKLSGEALQRASRAGGPELLITQGRAALANTRHRFTDGLGLAREAIRLDPNSGSAYGALGDALLNLGRYREAFKAYMLSQEHAISHSREPGEIMTRTGVRHEAYEVLMDSRMDAVAAGDAVHPMLGRELLALLPGHVHRRAVLKAVDELED